MKVVFRRLVIVSIVVAGFISTYDDTLAAGPPGPPGGGGGGPPCWPAPCIPIDGGIGFLLAAGLAYGGKKAYNSFKGKE